MNFVPYMYISSIRANSGSEFGVANTLAKWKKLEPNEINLSLCFVFNSLPARGDFCCLLTNSLDQDKARQNVGPDLDPNCLTPGIEKYSIHRVKYGTIISVKE